MKKYVSRSIQSGKRIGFASRLVSVLAASSMLAASVTSFAQEATSPTRTDPETGAIIARDFVNSKEGQTPELPVAKGKPNIIWIMLDDVGWGASSAFGGVISTPTFDGLAHDGLRYTNFHTTGVCAPTRAALMTGRNHNNVGMGLFQTPGMSAEFPGYSGRISDKDGMVAQYLHVAGYSTYAIGKWHLTPDREMSDLGPFDHWPVGKGFDHYFGFLSGAEDQYKPDLEEDRHHVKPDGRHVNIQLIDHAIGYIDNQEKLNPDKPFFLYIAPGATHAPVQVDKPWVDKYHGRFDAGWDVVRQQIFDRQKQMGLLPPNAVLPERNHLVPAWNTLTPIQKAVYNRQMEAYAGFLDETDHEIGRLVDYLKAKGLYNNTVISIIIGDNGASKEGKEDGTTNNDIQDIKNHQTIEQMYSQIDKIGSGELFSNYPIGWAQVMDTPFRKWKGDADSEGGTRNPLIMTWPGHLPAGQLRGQYGHVIDMLPTALEIAGATVPATIGGMAQTPIQGVSFTYTFNDAKAPDRHTQQYYFLFGAAAMYSNGWKADYAYYPDLMVIQNNPGITKQPNVNHGEWELYDLKTDFNERINLANRYPEKLEEMKSLFEKTTKENNAYPLINATDIWSRFNKFVRNQ